MEILKYLLAFGCSLAITLWVMPKYLIPFLHKLKFGQAIRPEGPESHQKKSGTPTMGGMVFVLVPILLMVILQPSMFLDLKCLIVILAYALYCMIGFIDDFIIVVKKDNEGLKPKYKLALQVLVAVLFYFMYANVAQTTITIPVIDFSFDLGFLYFFFILFMFAGASNAVNLTDGLDGLCAGTSLISLAPYIIFAILQQQTQLAIFLVAIVGALLGYLRYNAHPAKIFMGDTGSLALGGLFAAVAMVLKQELLLVLIGGVFVMETVSVIMQVTYFKLTKGKRIFKMTPIHHHFELCGLKETKVVLLFYCLAFIFSLLGLILGVI